MARDLAGCVVVEEVLFYYCHRLLHHPALYRHFHKVHHEFTAPMGVAAGYAHPLEHLILNAIPLILGPLVMRAHLFTLWVWIFIAVATIVADHSGYSFPFFAPSVVRHDFHHLRFNSNFGALGLLDWLHGTDAGSAA
ncbi:hypothetical protein DFJ73DRAFT_598588, partial [Zopfochytrium polystomum]